MRAEQEVSGARETGGCQKRLQLHRTGTIESNSSGTRDCYSSGGTDVGRDTDWEPESSAGTRKFNPSQIDKSAG